MKNIHASASPLRLQFIQYLTLHRKAPRTIHAYVSFVYELAKFHHQSPDQLDAAPIQRWLYHLIAERKLAPSTVNLAINALRAFYGGLLQRDIESLLRQVQRPKRPRRVPRPYSMAEIERLLTVGTQGNLRAGAFLMTVYGGGLRLSEATHIKIKDLDSARHRLLVSHPKGGHQRYTLLSLLDLTSPLARPAPAAAGPTVTAPAAAAPAPSAEAPSAAVLATVPAPTP
jgi:site-specific recombinase XerD